METPSSETTWRRCNSCKKPIAYGQKYWVCNVSTCNRKRTDLAFCEVSCWDAHVPFVNHRESWAEERTAPSPEEWAKHLCGEDKPKRTRGPRKKEEPEAAPAPKAPTVVLRRSGGGG